MLDRANEVPLLQRVPVRIGFYNDGPCEWCFSSPGTKIVNLPFNALITRVCGPCHAKAVAAGGNWQEICYSRLGTGHLGDDFSPCPMCEGSGYGDEGIPDYEEDLYGDGGRGNG
jgi:hypothetical protein